MPQHDPGFPAPLTPTGKPMRPWLRINRDWRRPDDPRSWQLWWNDTEAFGQVFPRPSAEEIAQFYELATYYTHDNASARADAGLLGRLLVALAWRLDRGTGLETDYWRSLVPAGARNALELGCGNGDQMLKIASLVENCVGVEPDAKARAVACAKGLEVLDGTAENLPAAVTDRRYDVILFLHVLEHCADPELALAQAAGLLTDGGVMVIETPNNAALGLQSSGAFWRWLDVPRHLNFFTETSLRGFAERAGLRAERCEYWGFTRQFLPDWIADETQIESILDGTPINAAARRRHVLRAARLLIQSAFAPAARKYDSVRLICRRA